MEKVALEKTSIDGGVVEGESDGQTEYEVMERLVVSDGEKSLKVMRKLMEEEKRKDETKWKEEVGAGS